MVAGAVASVGVLLGVSAVLLNFALHKIDEGVYRIEILNQNESNHRTNPIIFNFPSYQLSY